MTLDEATSLARVAPGRFTAQIPDGWQQGRGAFGGLVIALMARAARAEETDADRRLRVINAEIVGPVVVGEAIVHVAAVRRGSGVSTLEARIEQAGEIQARGTFVFGKTRSTDADGRWLAPPVCEPWDALPSIPAGPPAPVFTQHYEMRTRGPLPFAGAAALELVGWVRPRALPDRWAEHDVVALCDSWWPVALSRLAGPRPMATVAFTLELLVDPAALAPGRPFLYRATLPAGAGGYLLDLRELWTAEGELVALNQQTFCLIR